MENKNEISEEQIDIEEAEIGEDKPVIEPKEVEIKEYDISTVEKDGKKIGKILTVLVQHPEINERYIEISKVKYQEGEKIKQSGLWVKTDSEGKIMYRSAIGYLLRHLKIKKIKEMIKKTIDTIADENGYLIFKAY